MNSVQQPRSNVQDQVLRAIQGALREEKEPRSKRILKILTSTIALSTLVGFPFWISFRGEMNWIWNITAGFWVLYFLLGFAFYFKPQPRLMVSGLFGPFVIARMFLVSTVATIAEILICPSFVFLSSSYEWNPLSPLTERLMDVGGMSLCMGFCGFLFAFIASAIGLVSIRKAVKAVDQKSALILFSILAASQFPVFFVQVASEDLRPFVGYWVFGVINGFALAVGLKRLRS
ncbi:MAG: hypothetical protein JST80_13355 [Bdellovibrionales bacterium]|nr:hypothetical protein [Bdellovibrionales bacterium]